MNDDVLGKAYDSRLVRRLGAFVWPYRGLVSLSLVLLGATSAMQLAQPYLLKVAIDRFIGEKRVEGFLVPVSLYLLTLLAEFALGFSQIYTLERTGQNVVFDIRNRVFAHLERLPSAFFDRTPVGRLMTRVTTDVESLNEAFTSGLVLILADLVKLAAIVVILVAMDWRLALVTFAIVPPLWLLGTPGWLLRPLMRYGLILRLGRLLTGPVTAFVLLNVVFWAWHWPALGGVSCTTTPPRPGGSWPSAASV